MTLANKITVLRMVAIPLFVIALLENRLGWARFIFILSAASDALDGILARIRKERTPLGTFLDPLADKLLLAASFVAFTMLHWIPVWIFIAVFSRDLLIVLGWSVVYILTGNRKIEPRFSGKMTTALQMAVVLAKLLGVPPVLSDALVYAMVAATIASACDYMWVGNKRLGALG